MRRLETLTEEMRRRGVVGGGGRGSERVPRSQSQSQEPEPVPHCQLPVRKGQVKHHTSPIRPSIQLFNCCNLLFAMPQFAIIF
eukprot:scaffold28581_cov94-Isochrysis_galbana.AAC.4